MINLAKGESISLEFKVKAKPKDRPRFSRRFGKVHTHSTPKTAMFETMIANLARQKMWTMNMAPIEGLILAEIEFRFKKPKNSKLAAPDADLDNLLKSVLDALNEICFVDDSQIIEIHTKKHWDVEDSIRLKLFRLL